MSGTNQILPFATGGGANVLTPAAYAALTPLLAQGFAAGIAPSQQLNTVWRQSSFVAAAVAQLIADSTGLNVADDGVIANFENQLATAINLNYVGVGAGTANAITVTYLPAITTLHDGMAIWVKATAVNTGATTLNVNGLGVQPVLGGAHAALQGGELIANGWCLFIWNATLTSWVLIECTGGALQVPGGSYGTTPAQFDNTTKLATTAFVQRALGNDAGVVAILSATTLDATYAGKLVLIGGTTGYVVTLPLWSSVTPGTVIELQNVQPAGCTIQRQGTDVIQTGTGTITSFTGVNAGDSVRLVASISSGQWQAIAGTLPLRDTSGPFGSSLAGSGYQKLPSGLIIQWGNAITGGGGSVAVTFPITYPTACLQVLGGLLSNGFNSSVGYVGPGSTTGFTAYTSLGGTSTPTEGGNVTWISVGH